MDSALFRVSLAPSVPALGVSAGFLWLLANLGALHGGGVGGGRWGECTEGDVISLMDSN